MNNEKMNQIIDEVYENYSKEYEKDNSIGLTLLVQRIDGKSSYRKPDKERFIALCTHDKTFSEKWGLKIEERELSEIERFELGRQKGMWYEFQYGNIKEPCDENNIPTKLITITYNDIKTEVYE